MKRRIRKIVNFFAFNLLFFALYLNFIHKDKGFSAPVPVQTNTAAASFTGSVPVQEDAKNAQTTESKTEKNSATKPSIN